MAASWPLPLLGLAAALGGMFVIWLASLVRRDASLVDRFWGAGFAALAWLWAVAGPGGAPGRTALVLALVTLWGLRLSLYLTWRNWGQGEDYRYREMRRRWGDGFPWVSLGTVFTLQGLLMWIIAAPLFAAVTAPGPEGLTWLDAAGVLVWAAGFAFEVVGDAQLARFKADPAHRGQVMDRGLWGWTRHPNYFGDALVWWGLWLVAAAGGGWWTVFAPILMTMLLMRVSGVSLLEKRLAEAKPGWQEYAARVPAFFPRPPRRKERER